MAQRYYRGKKVIGIKPFTKKQKLKIYWLLALALLFIIYMIIMEFICSCLYLTVATATPFIMSWIFIALWTTFTYIKQKEKNYIFEKEE
ncbi:MAG: hypothetical protein DRQ44_16495 [Gammaproteobacteria bacterium]|nr:MAG: hypothetical protein DRQ44_16495 [Gammaproteobacteria bacterium]